VVAEAHTCTQINLEEWRGGLVIRFSL
jgi:hypothetical protein